MGSGHSGLYQGTRGSSQPFAPVYGVTLDMKQKDIRERIYVPGRGYLQNPSAVNLLSTIKDNIVYYEGRRANGCFTYVVDENGNLIFGKRNNPDGPTLRSPHPMLIGGKNPRVQCAGIIDIRNGKIFNIDVRSGHYKPHPDSLGVVEKILSSLSKETFDRKSEWRKNR